MTDKKNKKKKDKEPMDSELQEQPSSSKVEQETDLQNSESSIPYQEDENEGKDEIALLQEEKIRIKRIQVYEKVLKKLPELSINNWSDWIESLNDLADRLIVQNKSVLFEAASFYAGSKKLSLELKMKRAINFEDDLFKIIRKIYLSDEQKKFSVKALQILKQADQESLHSYLKRFQCFYEIHPASDLTEGNAQFRATILFGLNGMARQNMDVEIRKESLEILLQHLREIAEDEVWTGFQEISVERMPNRKEDDTKVWRHSYSTFSKNSIGTIGKTKESRNCKMCGWWGHIERNCELKCQRPGPGLNEEQRRHFWELKREYEQARRNEDGPRDVNKFLNSRAQVTPQLNGKCVNDDSKRKVENKGKLFIIRPRRGMLNPMWNVNNLYVLNVFINNHKLQAIVDSGASCNVLSKSFVYKNLPYVKKIKIHKLLKPAIGNEALSTEQVTLPVIVNQRNIGFLLLYWIVIIICVF